MNRTLAQPETMSRTAEAAYQQLLEGVAVTERRLELAGISTNVLEGGRGPSIVLLHGPGEYGAAWFRVLPALMETNHVVAPDLPGHGTTYCDGDLTAARALEWLGDLIAQTTPTPPVLLAHLLSGALAAHFVSEHPGRVAKLVLVDTFGLAPFEPAPEFGEAVMGFMTQPNRNTHEMLWQGCAYDLEGFRGALGRKWQALETYNIDRASVPSHQRTQHALFQAFGFPPVPEPILDSIRVPTTLIWGRHDLATRVEVARAASARFGWPLHVIESAGDGPAAEQPAAFLEVLRAVL